jgi:YidC/Oxa1 family membrane protein insertase
VTELWHAWIGLQQQILQNMATEWGLGFGLAVIALTLMVRTALLPLTWSLARRGAARQAQIAVIAPQLKLINERHAKDPRARMQATEELYRRHGLGVADGKGLLGALIQLPVVYGLYQALRLGTATTSFLWIRNLSRPDLILAVLAAVTTAAAMAVAPQASEHLRVAIVLVPAVLCFVAALHFSSGIALYWVTSNLFGAAQSIAFRRALRHAAERREY